MKSNDPADARSVFGSVNASRDKLPRAPAFKPVFNRLIGDLFSDGYDPWLEYQAVKSSLKIEGGLSPGAVQSAAERQESMAERALRLYVVAQHEVAAYTHGGDALIGAMKEHSLLELELDKAKGARTKQITDGDVASHAAVMYPDQWREVNDRREKGKLLLKYVEGLSVLAATRAATLRNLVSPGGRGRTIG